MKLLVGEAGDRFFALPAALVVLSIGQPPLDPGLHHDDPSQQWNQRLPSPVADSKSSALSRVASAAIVWSIRPQRTPTSSC
jgi:hypothetical protein